MVGSRAAVIAGLFVAVPAAATDHRLTAGDVTMSFSRAGPKLTMNYTVTPPQCPNQQCYINYGKPYQINIFVTDIRVPSPLGVTVPQHCAVSGFPLVFCSSARSTDDPAAALPLSASITVRVGTGPGATAKIRVDGYSLDAEKDGIPVPPYDCQREQTRYNEKLKDLEEHDVLLGNAMRDLRPYLGIGFVAKILAS
jgi:hypothetical protein